MEGRRAAKEYKRAQQAINEFRGTILDWDSLLVALTSLTAKESASINMALDTLAYGFISKPDRHDEFWNALKSRARDGVRVRIVTFSTAARERALREQFGPDPTAIDAAKIAKAVEKHKECTAQLRKFSDVHVYESEYFPQHLSFFEEQQIAVFAMHELSGGEVQSYAVRSEDPQRRRMCRDGIKRMSCPR